MNDRVKRIRAGRGQLIWLKETVNDRGHHCLICSNTWNACSKQRVKITEVQKHYQHFGFDFQQPHKK